MTDKLTDNEIIKTLQEMADYPHNYEEGQDLQNALDLINRLQAQYKDLAETVHNLTIEKDALFDKAEELKAEIERLNALVKTKNKLIEGLDQSISYAYDRAIKEFAERLKTEYAKGMSWFKKKESYYVNVSDIDNLLKELMGENND